MNLPENLKYSKDHEWVRIEGENLVIGITDFAQSQLGDIIYVDINELDEEIEAEEEFGSIEAVKTVSELFLPVSGKIIEKNNDLEDSPELVNEDPYQKGWIIKIKPNNIDDINNLLSAKDYQNLIKQ